MLMFDLGVDMKQLVVPQLRKRITRKVEAALRFLIGKRISMRACEQARRAIKRVLKPYIRAGVVEKGWYSRMNQGTWERREL